MKKIKFLSVLMLLLSVAVGISSCEEITGNNVSGYYASSTRSSKFNGKNYSIRSVYNFISDNEVVYYSMVANGRMWNTSYTGDRSTAFPEHGGWYYQTGTAKTYTYTKIDDKVYITNKGVILDVVDDGDGLVPEGSSYSEGYFKW
mgnify:CR=1 FL=1